MEVIKCKHCGAEEGFYTRQRVMGIAIFRYTKEGHVASDTGDVHDAIWYKGGTNAYCNNCDRILGKTNQLVTGFSEDDF